MFDQLINLKSDWNLSDSGLRIKYWDAARGLGAEPPTSWRPSAGGRLSVSEAVPKARVVSLSL